MNPKLMIREALGRLPLTAELDWQLLHRDHKINSRFNLESLREYLPDATAQVMPFIKPVLQAKKVFLFASSHSWIIHTALCGLTLRGLGNAVTLGFVPYGDYNKPVSRLVSSQNVLDVSSTPRTTLGGWARGLRGPLRASLNVRSPPLHQRARRA